MRRASDLQNSLPRGGSGGVSTSDFLKSVLPLLLGSVCAQLLLEAFLSLVPFER